MNIKDYDCVNFSYGFTISIFKDKRWQDNIIGIVLTKYGDRGQFDKRGSKDKKNRLLNI